MNGSLLIIAIARNGDGDGDADGAMTSPASSSDGAMASPAYCAYGDMASPLLHSPNPPPLRSLCLLRDSMAGTCVEIPFLLPTELGSMRCDDDRCFHS